MSNSDNNNRQNQQDENQLNQLEMQQQYQQYQQQRSPFDREPERNPRRGKLLVIMIVIAALLVGHFGFGAFTAFAPLNLLAGGSPLPADGIRTNQSSLDLTISTTSTQVVVESHSGSDIRIVYTPSRTGRAAEFNYQFSQNGRRLEIAEQTRAFNFGVNVGRPGTLTVHIPHKSPVFGNLDINVTSGGVRIYGNSSEMLANTVNAGSTSGGVFLRDFRAESIAARTTSGSVSLNNISSTSANITATATSGGIRAYDINSARDFIVSATSGGIRIDGGEIQETLNAGVTSGGVRIENLAVGGNITASTTSGGIIINNVDVPQNAMNLSATSGGITVDGQRWSR